MKSKLALWSWILPVIGVALSVLSLSVAGENLGLGITLLAVSLLGSIPLGLILGIIALKKISLNQKLAGRGHAIAGIILNAPALLSGIFILLNGLFA